MFKLIKILFSLIIILVGAALVVPFLIPLDTYKKEAIARLSEATGREIKIEGDIRLQLVPNIAIALNKVTVGNPKGFSSPYLAYIDSLNVEVALKPLFDKHVEIHRLTLNKPEFFLETLVSGSENWNMKFNPPSASFSPIRERETFNLFSNANAQASAPSSGQQSFSLSSLNLSGFSVTDGKLHVQNAKEKSAQNLEAINLKADTVSVGKPLAMDGSLKWNGEVFNVAAKAASLQSLLDKKPTQVALKADSTHIKVNYTGSVSPAGINGKIDVGSPSLVKLMAWLGKPMDYKKTTLLFAANGDIKCTTSECGLTGSQLAIDALRLAGDVSVKFAGKTSVKGNLKTNILDLSPYMDAPKTAWNNPFISNANAISSHWSATPFHLSALNAMNADVTFAASQLIAPPWNVADVKLNAVLQNGAATLNLNQAKLFEGNIKGIISATPRDNYLNASANLDAAGVRIESFLKTLNNEDRISGTGNFKLKFTGRGNNQASLISTLNGDGSVMIRDGAIKGINLAEMARNVQSAFKTVDSSSQKTDFAELGGTYTISNGVISNKDLSMKAPFIRLTGIGDINLPAYTIHYRLLPELVNTKQGQDGKDKSGIVVPVIVSGSLDNPQFAPDLQSIVNDAINDPEKLKENVKAVKKQIKEHKTEIKEIKQDLKEGLKDPKKLLEDPNKMNKVNDLLNQFR